MGKQVKNGRNAKRTLVNCCNCLAYIYTVTKFNENNNEITCAECRNAEIPMSAEDFAALVKEQTGPFHARMARYHKRNGIEVTQ